MDRPTSIPLRVGAWCVNPNTGRISRDGEVVRLEARTLRLLVFLAQRAGEVVSIDELLEQVWSGVVVSPDSVYQAIASLRRLLGDDARQPNYISTVPRLGYRLVARVSAWEDARLNPIGSAPSAPSTTSAESATSTSAASAASAGSAAAAAIDPAPHASRMGRLRRPVLGAALVLLTVGVALLLMLRGAPGFARLISPDVPAHSVAVLPLLDLTTQEMNEEYFADGLTEELIDRLSRIPGLRVPAPESSFYFKGRKLPVTDIARSLGVAYVLSGNVRKSGATLRIAVRLVRAADGYVIWSESFDGSYDDELKLQDDIAGAVAKTLSGSIR
ncbi:MAG TPA: winged helix-turn-helix domain-containing protein [Steroidobacteraceae bacterium]|nr:winged helix-turn-helix domain-containing protein [Steroidobacteraceae bacterium]